MNPPDFGNYKCDHEHSQSYYAVEATGAITCWACLRNSIEHEAAKRLAAIVNKEAERCKGMLAEDACRFILEEMGSRGDAGTPPCDCLLEIDASGEGAIKHKETCGQGRLSRAFRAACEQVWRSVDAPGQTLESTMEFYLKGEAEAALAHREGEQEQAQRPKSATDESPEISRLKRTIASDQAELVRLSNRASAAESVWQKEREALGETIRKIFRQLAKMDQCDGVAEKLGCAKYAFLTALAAANALPAAPQPIQDEGEEVMKQVRYVCNKCGQHYSAQERKDIGKRCGWAQCSGRIVRESEPLPDSKEVK